MKYLATVVVTGLGLLVLGGVAAFWIFSQYDSQNVTLSQELKKLQLSREIEQTKLNRAKLEQQHEQKQETQALQHAQYKTINSSPVVIWAHKAGAFCVALWPVWVVVGLGVAPFVVFYGRLNHFTRFENGDLKIESLPIKDAKVFGQRALKIREQEAAIKAAIFQQHTTDEQIQRRLAMYKQFRSLAASPTAPKTILPHPVSPLALEPATLEVPTFHALLQRGDIAPGKQMILGYSDGIPRKGSFLDIYSAAIAGESGSGKTASLLFLIGSGLVADHVRFFGIDPHYPHPKSLGFKTKTLWDAGLMRMATYKDDMLAMLHDVEQIIDNRLKQRDTDTTPVVLVIDELAFLAKTSVGGAIAHTMERISTEGRKCQVYLLASSQTWLVARTGESSVVRDTLTSAFVHRIKPKQANLLLQDKEEVDKVKRYCKKPGQVLLCPVNDESVICRIPFATEADMALVVDMVREANGGSIPVYRNTSVTHEMATDNEKTKAAIKPTIANENISQSSSEKVIDINKGRTFSQKSKMTVTLTPDAILQELTQRYESQAENMSKNQWQKITAEAIGITYSTLKNIMLGHSKISEETAQKFTDFFKA